VSDGEASGDSCDPVTYDLSTPPSRSDLGMPEGESVLNVACDAGFAVTLKLPEGASTEIEARRVNADSLGGGGNPEQSNPATMDVHSVAFGTAEAIQVAGDVADDFGIDTSALSQWEAQVESAPGDNLNSPFMRSMLGYLTAEMQVQHLGASGNNYVHLVLVFR
jgi:hypothetical protein